MPSLPVRLPLIALLAAGLSASAAPVNDDCANATVVSSFPFADVVDMTTATTEVGDPAPTGLCGGIGANSVWYRVPAGDADALLRGIAAGTGTQYGVRIVTGGCGAPVVKENWCFDPSFPLPEFGVYAEGAEVLIEIVNRDVAGTLELTIAEVPEFLVDVDGGNLQSVAGGPDGFLAVWMDTTAIGARAYDAQGAPLGAQFPLNPGGFGFGPDAAGAGDGSFFVVWEGAGIEAVRVDGPGVVVSLPALPSGEYPVVAADTDGDFVVAWHGPDGSSDGIFAQRFDRDGTAQGAAFQVNTYTTLAQRWPSVAMAPGGAFVIVWGGGEDDTMVARLYDVGGSPVTGEFAVSIDSDGSTTTAAGVDMDPAGNFVVVWEGGYVYGPGGQPFFGSIVGRRFDASATPVTGEFLVSTDPTTYYSITGRADVAVADSGEFMVTWEAHADGYVSSSDTDIWARRFDAAGSGLGPQFLVNTFRGDAQYDPDVAATPAGEFMVVWNDYYGFTRGDTTIARTFPKSELPCAPAALTGCRTPTIPLKSKLLLLDRPDDTDDQLRWKFVKGAGTDAADLGDPTTDEDYVLCMYDASSPGGALLMENRIPAGGTCGAKPCWKALGNPPGSKGYRYKDNDRTPHGVQKMVLKPGAAGKSKVVLKGGQDHVSDGDPGAPALPLALPVTVQLQNASGECWQATYDTGGVGVNDPGFFKGSGS